MVPAHYCRCVPTFGYLWVNGRLHLTIAFRSLPRPSSAPIAKAFTLCSFSLNLLCSSFLTLTFCSPSFGTHVLQYTAFLSQAAPRQLQKILRILSRILFSLVLDLKNEIVFTLSACYFSALLCCSPSLRYSCTPVHCVPLSVSASHNEKLSSQSLLLVILLKSFWVLYFSRYLSIFVYIIQFSRYWPAQPNSLVSTTLSLPFRVGGE